MSERIQINVDPIEKERYRQAAAREGITLSEWIRAAAQEKLAGLGIAAESDLGTIDAFRSFFDETKSHEKEREPAWETHRENIERTGKSSR
jgi:hypothetical protein